MYLLENLDICVRACVCGGCTLAHLTNVDTLISRIIWIAGSSSSATLNSHTYLLFILSFYDKLLQRLPAL